MAEDRKPPIPSRRSIPSHERIERFGARQITRYSPELALGICERIMNGETLTEICKERGLPSRETFRRWCMLYDSLKRAYDAARELSAQSLEEEALDMARTLKGPNTFTSQRIRAYQVAMEQLRWSASRRDPARYGNQNTPTLTVPIQINTNLDLGGEAQIADGQHIFKIEAQIEAPSLPEPDGEDIFQTAAENEGERNILPKSTHGVRIRQNPKGFRKGVKRKQEAQENADDPDESDS